VLGALALGELFDAGVGGRDEGDGAADGVRLARGPWGLDRAAACRPAKAQRSLRAPRDRPSRVGSAHGEKVGSHRVGVVQRLVSLRLSNPAEDH